MTLPDPLHADALATLRDWRAPDADQDALRTRFVAHLEATPDGMWRSAYPDHITAGALVIDSAGERVLLNLHKKARRWFAFGGHCEPGDATLADVAAREAREESGIPDLRLVPAPAQLDVHPVPFCDPRGPDYTVRHLDVRYVAIAPASAQEITSEESLDVRWWPVDGLPELEPGMVDLVGIARSLV
ncbi:NUDIX domain-containing protein [Nocardioides humilatus]|uniref:NUDIX domain-containing protein n=1 Tax=Nocardioides humilatus TaxID=2607660 RepID=A0A5B1LKM3_9ACTN|nr:NUDIX domain-containing protein [Nocardioides humilatus]KAA1421006.1 NUDIX domain-containing protein [Nocardioides humilatus]